MSRPIRVKTPSVAAQPVDKLGRRRLGAWVAACAAGASLTPARAADVTGVADQALKEVTLMRSVQWDMKLAGRLRRVWVAQPQAAPHPQGHPALFVLDGNALFPLLSALLRLQEARPGDVRPRVPMIVALGEPSEALYDQGKRARDFSLEGPDAGGPRLLEGLGELQQAVADRWPVDRRWLSLMGHSFSGQFALHAALSGRSGFTRVLAASPSIWWQERALLQLRQRWLAGEVPGAADLRQLVITAGALEEPGVGAALVDERVRRQAERRQVSRARDMAQALQAVAGRRIRFELLPGEDHGSVLMPSARLALEMASPASADSTALAEPRLEASA